MPTYQLLFKILNIANIEAASEEEAISQLQTQLIQNNLIKNDHTPIEIQVIEEQEAK